MKFFGYLNEGRTKSIGEDKVLLELLNKCSQSVERFKKDHKIFRKIIGYDGDYGIVKKTTSPRKSANTSNYYTLFINNHPLWKNYPKREIICSGGNGYRAINHFGGSGSTYLIFPYNNAKIGICPDNDIWDSFDWDIEYINVLLNNNLVSDDNWNKFEMETKNISANELFDFQDFSPQMSVWDFFEKHIGPKENNFKVLPISKYNLTMSDDLEVWTDSTCICVKDENVYDIMKQYDRLK